MRITVYFVSLKVFVTFAKTFARSRFRKFQFPRVYGKMRLIKCCSTISQDDEDDTALPGAHGDRLGVVLDHDQPPDRQHQGVPDGHGVHDVGEVDVEQEEHCPGVGILKNDNI